MMSDVTSRCTKCAQRSATHRIDAPAGALGLKDLGVEEPVNMEDRADRYLIRFRKPSMFQDEGEIVRPPN